eukprot:8786678-Alexandrium_andersonii.AAC.1
MLNYKSVFDLKLMLPQSDPQRGILVQKPELIERVLALQIVDAKAKDAQCAQQWAAFSANFVTDVVGSNVPASAAAIEAEIDAATA